MSDLALARTALRRFARATNLLLAGRSFRVLGDDGQADALRRVMIACGGRGVAGSPDYVFASAGSTWDRAAQADASVVVDASGTLELPATARPSARDGILEVDDVQVVSAAPSLPARAALPAAAGRIEWAASKMPLTASLAHDLHDDGLVAGRRIAVSMVLEPKTAVLALALRDAGADVAVFAHHYETDDAVARELRDRGVPVFADGSGDADSDRVLALRLLDTEPQLLLDDGAHVIRLAHRERPTLVEAMLGAAEETTSGIRAVRTLGDELRMPVIAVNDAVTKTRFDNRYGTGQSCVFAIADTLEAASAELRVASFDGARVIVIGFGPVGQGVAQFSAALGGHVSVCDIDPRAELEARYAGYETGSAADLVAGADIVISATGVARTVPQDLLELAPDGTVFAVAGGVDDEIEVGRLRAVTDVAAVDDHVETFAFADGRSIAVIDGGGCVNITAGEGNPIEIMDLSFAAQLQAVRALVTASERRVGLFALSVDADREVARRALDTAPGSGHGGGTEGRGSDRDTDNRIQGATA